MPDKYKSGMYSILLLTNNMLIFQLEKEALTKGVPLGQAHDIDIPPPRPKRKPNNPYPRKTPVTTSISSSVGSKDGKPVTAINSLSPSKQVLDLENDPPPEVCICFF